MDDSSERMKILEMIESGQISAEDGLRMLAELPEQAEAEGVRPGAMPGEPDVLPSPPPDQSAAGLAPEPESFRIDEASGETYAAGFTPAPAPARTDGPPLDQSSAGFAAAPESTTTPEPAPAAPSPTAGRPVEPEILHKSPPPDFAQWQRYWMIPLWIGMGIVIFSALLMAWALESTGFGFWFFCTAIPLAFGILILVIGAQSRSARWLHLRVRQAPGERPQNIAISMPLPIGLASWFFRTFRGIIPGMDQVPVNIDEILTAVRDSTDPDNPMYIEVDEDDGERVEIYIG